MTPERIAELRDISNLCTCGSHIVECLDAIEKLRAELEQKRRSLVLSEEQLRVQTEDSKIKQREIYRLELAIHKLVDERDRYRSALEQCAKTTDGYVRDEHGAVHAAAIARVALRPKGDDNGK